LLSFGNEAVGCQGKISIVSHVARTFASIAFPILSVGQRIRIRNKQRPIRGYFCHHRPTRSLAIFYQFSSFGISMLNFFFVNGQADKVQAVFY